MSKQKGSADKEFRLASWAIDNPSVIYVMIAIFFVMGLSAYFSMPREDFPEVEETKIYVSTPYPGNTAEDIERLITDPLEERLKNISNLVDLTSTSQEDYSMIVVEFDEHISVQEAKLKVQDEVDAEKAGEDWPIFNGAKVEPNVFNLNLTESFPIMNVNITGDYPVEQLKEYGELLQDEIEDLAEVKEVGIRGGPGSRSGSGRGHLQNDGRPGELRRCAGCHPQREHDALCRQPGHGRPAAYPAHSG